MTVKTCDQVTHRIDQPQQLRFISPVIVKLNTVTPFNKRKVFKWYETNAFPIGYLNLFSIRIECTNVDDHLQKCNCKHVFLFI